MKTNSTPTNPPTETVSDCCGAGFHTQSNAGIDNDTVDKICNKCGNPCLTIVNPPTEPKSVVIGYESVNHNGPLSRSYEHIKVQPIIDSINAEPTVEKWESDFDEKFGDPNAIPAKNAYGDDVYYKYHIEYMPDSLIKDFIRTLLSHSVQEAKAEEREKQFTQDELNIMWIDYKSLVATTKMMNRTVVGDKKLEFILDSNDQIREEILKKLDLLSTLNTKASLKQEEDK